GTRRLDLCCDRLHDLQIEVGRHQLQLPRRIRLDQHVGQNGDGVAPFDHRLDVAEAFQEHCAFDRRFHSNLSSLPVREKSLRGRGSRAIRRRDSLPLKMPTFLNARIAPRKPCLQSIPIRANEGAMRRALPLLLTLAFPVTAIAAPAALGVFDGWGAFRDPAAPRCYAIAAPAATIGVPQVKAYASVGYWPKSGIRGQFYVRLSKARRDGAELRPTIGSRRLYLSGKSSHGMYSHARMTADVTREACIATVRCF